MTDFVHLRTHSHYSLLSSPVRVKDLVAAAAADGQRALGLTDNGNLFGAIEFYKACKSKDIKPILGMVTYCAAVSHREPSGAGNPSQQLTLFAKDNEGFANLRTLSSCGYLDGFHYRPRIDKDLLAKHSKGLIVLSGDLMGDIAQLLQAGDTAAACRAVAEMQEIVGPENYFLEIMETGVEAQKRLNPLLLELHERLGVPLVATNDVHYLRQEDSVAQEIMMCIKGGKSINDENRFRPPTRELYFKSRAEMSALFQHAPQACATTLEIADRCDVELDFKTYHLPVFDSGPDRTPEELFEEVCFEGARQRYGEITPKIEERLRYEIGIINQLGFCSYFLITADFIDYARNHDIPVGPGRGSAAGSIVAYAMRITDLDPLKYNLIFERFLNASRVSMPDIDVDFCGLRRDEVIDYVREKYGHDCVSQIITFGTMASRGVLRDVGRVLEMPLGEIDEIAKKVPQGPGASLVDALETDKDLQEIRDRSTEHKRLFDLGVKLEGMARHSSVHAAGVVVADRPLRDYVPLCRNGDDIVTQWQMTELEEVGLLKVDFLGLKTLTILTEACRLIKHVHGVDLDLGKIPLDDPETYELMTRGDTLGVFQLESSGMRELLGRLKPDTFEDVIAVLALYRPGPLGSGMVDMFCKRKHGEETTEYPHESVEDILEETYGVIVYQEQVMRIANVLANFSMNEADSLRKAMGKKKPEVMAKFKEKFIDGAAENGHARNFSKELFETIEYFAGYGFNKSHSAAYALITYQTAYLKAHYRIEFIAANMTVESGTTDKLKEFVDAVRQSGLRVLPPDINRSEPFFTVEDGAIRYGLSAIKGVGAKLAEQTSEARRATGEYTSVENYCENLDQMVLNKGALEALTCAGAFDSIEPSRKQTMEGLERAIRASAQAREDKRRGQGALFSFDAPPEPSRSKRSGKVEDWSELDRLNREKTALGFYFSGHPFARRGAFLTHLPGSSSEALAELEHGDDVRPAGMNSDIRIM
ncbi:MAG: DNA polymerase III subunit alpha, partial [Planctomycetes bacterium]|nr:DNA polymerase III subunit alpha [Planctomycetota bacterium]